MPDANRRHQPLSLGALAIEDLLQDREVLQARIRELEQFIETEE